MPKMFNLPVGSRVFVTNGKFPNQTGVVKAVFNNAYDRKQGQWSLKGDKPLPQVIVHLDGQLESRAVRYSDGETDWIVPEAEALAVKAAVQGQPLPMTADQLAQKAREAGQNPMPLAADPGVKPIDGLTVVDPFGDEDEAMLSVKLVNDSVIVRSEIGDGMAIFTAAKWAEVSPILKALGIVA